MGIIWSGEAVEKLVYIPDQKRIFSLRIKISRKIHMWYWTSPVARPYHRHFLHVQNCSTLRSTIHKCWSRGLFNESNQIQRSPSKGVARAYQVDRVQVFSCFINRTEPRIGYEVYLGHYPGNAIPDGTHVADYDTR